MSRLWRLLRSLDRYDAFALTFPLLLCGLFASLVVWSVHRENACEARPCQASTSRAMLIDGNCICVEVPR